MSHNSTVKVARFGDNFVTKNVPASLSFNKFSLKKLFDLINASCINFAGTLIINATIKIFSVFRFTQIKDFFLKS